MPKPSDLDHPFGRRSTPALTVTIGAEALDEIVEAVSQRVEERLRAQLDPPRPESPYLSVREAAEFMRCSRARVYDLVSSRRLRRYKDGSRVLLSRAEIVEYLDDLTA